MKVLHILYELKYSGAEIMYVDAAPAFQDRGFELTVMGTAPNLGEYAPHFRNAGYGVVHKPYPKGLNVHKIKYYREFIQFLKKSNFDVIHIHVHAFMWTLAFCTWIAGKRPIYTFHSIFLSHSYSYLYHILKRWTAKNILGCRFQSISDSVCDHELTYYHNKTKKVYNWYGENRFFPAQEEEKQRIREEMNISAEALVLITIGICNEVKRHCDIIKALPYIMKEYPSSLYLHLGEGYTENEEKELAVELGVNRNIRFCGNQTDVRKFLVASDIYLMTSKHEGISITTIEAMACGIPAILYDVPGLRDFNKTGENCCLIPEDYSVLAEKVIELHANPEVSARLSANARELVNNTYHMKKNVSEIIKLYTQ